MTKKWMVSLLCLAAILIAAPLWAQEKQEEANTGQDPTKPLTRFDLRLKYQDTLIKHREQFIATPRLDKPIPLGGGWLLSTRFDLPLVYNDIPSRDNRDGDGEFGLGDLLTQFLFIKPLSPKLRVAGGAWFIWPTATQDQTGTGKWLAGPTVAAAYDISELSKGSFVAGLLRQNFSYAGPDRRDDINETIIQPVLNVNLPKFWFVTVAPEIKYNWKNKNQGWFVPLDLMVGKLLNRTTVVSVEGKYAIADKYPLYDWEIEARIGLFF